MSVRVFLLTVVVAVSACAAPGTLRAAEPANMVTASTLIASTGPVSTEPVGGVIPGTADPVAPSSDDIGFLTTRGRSLVDASGHPFLIKGINLGNWLMQEGYLFKFDKAKSPRQIMSATEAILGPDGTNRFWDDFRQNYITEEDIRYIRALGFNTVRVPFHWALFMDPNNPTSFTGPGYRLIDRLIAWCRAAGLRVILDMHAAPGGQSGVNHDDGSGYPLLFYVPKYQTETITLWRHLAERYRDEPTVIGFDLLNEPIAPYHDIAFLNPRLEPLYRRISAAIREVDPNHILFLSGAQWSTNFAVFGPPFDHKVVYSYHKFWSATSRMAISEYLNFANRYEVPVWLGESGEASDDWTQAFRELHERYGVGWTFWTYKNMDSVTSVVSIARPAGWDAAVAISNRLAVNDRTADAAAAGPMNVDTSAAEIARARTALAEYLENIKLANCRFNQSYIDALGLRVVPPASIMATSDHRRASRDDSGASNGETSISAR